LGGGAKLYRMKRVLWIAAALCVVTPILLVGSCYVQTRQLVTECEQSCNAQGLKMSSFISEDPLSPFPKGQCICLVEDDDQAAVR
jgi:hypothetical protein